MATNRARRKGIQTVILLLMVLGSLAMETREFDSVVVKARGPGGQWPVQSTGPHLQHGIEGMNQS